MDMEQAHNFLQQFFFNSLQICLCQNYFSISRIFRRLFRGIRRSKLDRFVVLFFAYVDLLYDKRVQSISDKNCRFQLPIFFYITLLVFLLNRLERFQRKNLIDDLRGGRYAEFFPQLKAAYKVGIGCENYFVLIYFALFKRLYSAIQA